ncbi:MAG: choice-of-anchor J domain-containing protein [Flavisolibacter sp.]|nr:choice-of-anchor J domain-containing protein [Flavisolibacter sp.]
MNGHRPILTVVSLLLFLSLTAQTRRTLDNKCGTAQHLQQKLEQNAVLRERFEQKKIEFNRTVSTRSLQKNARLTSVVYIPVVFHIVMNNPNLVTDAQIQAQLDTLNKTFFGANADSTRIPSYFKPFAGKSSIQFCLAQRTPDGDATEGIERITTLSSPFGLDDRIKHSYSGGANAWNPAKYFNVWVCAMTDGLLGYSTMPGDGSAPSEEGVVIEYRALSGGSFSAYNSGKTLTHETGHYFNLFHIWGDDGGGCTEDDLVNDTPKQADASHGGFSGLKFDICTPSGNGIMYQNYMDYTDDSCLVMFTNGQVDRMETALSMYRPSLLSSNGCQPVVVNNYDVQLRSVNQPSQRICTSVFTPQVTIKNKGAQNLTSLQINVKIDDGPVTTYQWTGSVSTFSLATINLNNLNVAPGNHTLTVYIANPSNNTDQDRSNDTLQLSFDYFPPVTDITESFENLYFPPQGWDVVNNDNAITWQRVNGIAKTGNASVKMDNLNYGHVGEMDDLRMPSINIPASLDSAFLTFELAAATFTDTNRQNNNWDTLQVLISTDCGQTYTSLYKKWGKTLVTAPPTQGDFIPYSTQWRKESVNLADYIGKNDLIIAFRNTTGFENNIYLDDINLRKVIVNPNVKEQGFVLTPNPTNGVFTLQFYPQPNNLKAIQVFNSVGQKIFETVFANGQGYNNYQIDLSQYQKGVYMVTAIFEDKMLTKKIIKL